MTKQDVLKRLRVAIKPYPNRQTAASALGLAPAYLSDVLNGRRAPGPKILEALGLEKNIHYTESK